MDTYAYKINNTVYINLTNQCSNSCDFCIRNTPNFHDLNLWLSKEPNAGDIIKALEILDVDTAEKEVVICGFGEPIYRLNEVKQIAKHLHSIGKTVRINTNGQANLIYGRNIAPELAGLIDSISISLNAVNAKKYDEICHSIYGEAAFYEVINFAKECLKYIPSVTMSVVDIISKEDQNIAKEIADSIGVQLRIRNYSE